MHNRTKPHFQTVIDKQQIAQHRVTNDLTKRTPVEIANFQRHLEPCPVEDVELPQLPLVRLKETDTQLVVDGGVRWALIGEIAQLPGKLILLNLSTAKIETMTADLLELVPPSELA